MENWPAEACPLCEKGDLPVEPDDLRSGGERSR